MTSEDTPSAQDPSRTGPLAGVRIIDLTQVLAGPFATMLLADQGADVVKIEPVAVGDLLRGTKSFRKNDLNAFAINNNRGKKSVAVDLRNPEGLRLVKQLVAGADVFAQNFRPGVVERLGLGPDDLRATNPRLITVSSSGYGSSGPDAERPVYDPIMQAVSGHIALQRAEIDGPPDLIRSVVIDKATALSTAQAITAALFSRERTGRGQHISINMLDVATWFFWPDGMMANTMLDDDVTQGRRIGELYRITQCKNGQLVYWTASPRDLEGFYTAIGRPELFNDPDLGWPYYRSNLEAFLGATEPVLAGLDVDQAVAALQANDVPSAKVLDFDEVHLHPQVMHNAKIVDWHDEVAGHVRQAMPPADFSDTPVVPWRHLPLHGSHTDQVLAELGCDSQEISRLREEGVVA
ncbi:MAG: crotonobetainyl-CoA:carnitine CoA-transferase CaiB-like acyl-CoA transferase [Acidimicrobiales bacterium]|jgi:crotonobetainyl-CoA:carnitine CoA-transferase CaiB-like acyl-CoA transferase